MSRNQTVTHITLWCSRAVALLVALLLPTLVLNGGIFQSFPEYVQLLKGSVPTDINFIDSDAPPVYGCAVECLWDAGIEASPAFRKTFLEEYRSLPVLRYNI